ncbi:MAG TPA: hypothetical protein VM260_27370 [Pirellula sp.]|nr:hypothetical protein [Pirellula sp.]
MAKSFDLRKQLKLHDKQLLRRRFSDLPEMASVPWDTLRPHQVEHIIAVWERLGEPLRPSYALDHLLDPSFHFAIEESDGIASVLLRRVRFEPTVSIHGLEYLEYKSTNDASYGKTRDMIHRKLDAYELDATQVTVTQASFQLRFMSDGEGNSG